MVDGACVYLTDLSSVEYGEEPGKHGGVDIDGQESKHPRQPKQWEQDNGCFQQGSTIMCCNYVMNG